MRQSAQHAQPWTRAQRPAARRRLGATAAATALTLSLYSIGISRAFGYDAGYTITHFVQAPSIWDPWRRQVFFNNHPLLSFLERLVLAATDSVSETTMRALPILFAAVAVGAVVWFLSERWSLAGSFVGGLLVAVNPLVIDNGREVRGYSLLLLCSVVSTAMIVRATRRSTFVYGAALVIGAVTHIYALALVPCHVAYLLVRRRSLRPWILPWGVGVFTGGLAFIPSIEWIGERGRDFRPSFPLDLLYAALGGAPLAVAATALIVAANAHRFRGAAWAIALGAAMVVAVWVYAPLDLYPRFFLWGVPLIALAVAVAGSHDRRIVWLGAAAVALTIAPQVGDLRTPELANRAGARFLAPYPHACVLGSSIETMGPYGRQEWSYLEAVADLSRCDAALVLYPAEVPQLVDAARRRFAQERRLLAEKPGIAFFDQPPAAPHAPTRPS